MARRSGVIVVALVLGLLVGAPAGAKDRDGGKDKGPKPAKIERALLEQAQQSPEQEFDVIIESEAGLDDAESAAIQEDSSGKGKDERGRVHRRLSLIRGVAAIVNGRRLERLSKRTGLTITANRPVTMFAAPTNDQLWTQAASLPSLWGSDASPAPEAPAIAMVDSGIEPRADFGNRLIHSVTITTAPLNSAGDGHGHGTFMAGLAAGSAAGYAGSAPNAKLVSLDVLDDEGKGRTSDVIAAADWILTNKDAYGIKVANFSLGTASTGATSPVNRAVQKLWFAGVTVVASAGNYAEAGARSNVKYAPANDPFVITVGAADIGLLADASDDTVAPWSAWGYTRDGFAKPEIVAPGRYIVGAVPTSATLPLLFPDRIMAPGYMRMSGTSLSAAIVSGIAAQILARHPELTPDQVKGALMLKANAMPLTTTSAEGVGGLNAAGSAAVVNAPNPNLALNGFKVSDPNGGALPVFDYNAWYAVASTNPAWNSSTWSESSWSESTWSESTWNESSWSESTWNESTWNESTWNESSWYESSWRGP